MAQAMLCLFATPMISPVLPVSRLIVSISLILFLAALAGLVKKIRPSHPTKCGAPSRSYSHPALTLSDSQHTAEKIASALCSLRYR
jgi:hypothetical protein